MSKKYIPKNEFRYNNGPISSGHPNYIFGETKNKYKTFSLTTTKPTNGVRYLKLTGNPNPEDKRITYLISTVQTPKKEYLDKEKLPWRFNKADMSIVRGRRKKYDKSVKKHKKKK